MSERTAHAPIKAPETSGQESPGEGLGARVVREEARALDAMADRMGPEFDAAVEMIVRCERAGGTVLVSGLGKSGLVGQKISATLASLGVPSHFVHPTEAAHGDLGRFRKDDVCVCLSHSGETAEVVDLAAVLRQDGIGLIAITRGDASSSLAKLCGVSLATGVEIEAGGGQVVAPTCSTTCTIAMGDALALGAAERLGLGPADFARRHPGGLLGGLLRPVTELLRFRAGENLAVVTVGCTVREALDSASAVARRPGALLVVDTDGVLAGVFTDGDLRRLVLRSPEGLNGPVEGVMTADPVRLRHTATARDAVTLVRTRRVDEIPVVDDAGRPVGLLDVQDLVALKLVEG